MAFWVTFHPETIVQFGFRAGSPQLDAAVVSMFLHQNLLHLGGNMIFIAAIGPYVEFSAGWWRFLLVYLLGGLVGVFAHWLFFRGNGMVGPYVGASACASACIGYGAVRYWSSKVPLAPKLAVPTWSVALLWLVLQIAGMFVTIGDSIGGTAYAAHLGGLVWGLLASLVFGAPRQAEIRRSQKLLEGMEDESPNSLRIVAESLLKENPEDESTLLQIADTSQRLGEYEEEEKYRILAFRAAKSPDLNSVDRLIELGAISRISSGERLKLASKLPALGAIKILKTVVYGDPSDPERANALLALASLEPDQGWAVMLAKEYPLDPATEIARRRNLL